jgi:nitrate reductase alpha subunit
MPLIKLVERDYGSIYNKFIALGPLMTKLGNNVKGIDWNTDQEYEELKKCNYTVKEPGVSFGMPSLEEDIAVCDSVMRMAPETNGEVAHKSWSALSKKTGIDHHHLYAGRHEDKITFRDIQAQPRKIITAPTWSGIESETVSYTAGYTNIHEHIPFRTLTGRAHFYQDHEWMLDFGEGFCCLQAAGGHAGPQEGAGQRQPRAAPDPVLDHAALQVGHPLHLPGQPAHAQPVPRRPLLLDRRGRRQERRHPGQRLGRGGQRQRRHGGESGGQSQRVPRGMAMMYHAQEKNVNVPGSPTTGKRGGILNSVTRVVVKPTHMIGGYVQLAYSFNYYGPVGSNRDEVVVVRKIEDQRHRLAGAAADAGTAKQQRNPVGIGPK